MSVSRVQPSEIRPLSIQLADDAGNYHDRYPIDKFLALDAYCRDASAWRVLYALVVTPLPGLVAAILPAFVPLHDVSAGPDVAFCCHYVIFSSSLALGLLIPALAATHVPATVYSVREAAVVSVCCGLFSFAFTYPLFRLWRFPTPFVCVITAPTWMLALAFAHVVVLRRKLWEEARLLTAMRQYLRPLLIQVSQIAVYPAFSVLFDRLDNNGKLAMTLLFPGVKFAMKRVLFHYCHDLGEYSAEVAVSGIEIASSLYQSMILQTAPSSSAMAIIIGLDVVLGVWSIKVLMDKRSSVPRHELVRTAVQKISPPIEAICPWTATSITSGAIVHETVKRASPLHQSAEKPESDAIVRQALSFASAAEAILLVEYFEVVVPLINGVFLAVTSQLPSAKYNSRLRGFYKHPDLVASAVQSIFTYSLLQGVSCVAMHLVMKRRYGTSAVHHLAFVLERHGLSIRGKMISWLTYILYFTVIHYGTDFSFKFEYSTVPMS